MNEKTYTVVRVIYNKDDETSFDKEKNVIKLQGFRSPTEFDAEIGLHSSVFKKIFHKRKSEAADDMKRLSIVKVTYNGKSIYRNFRGVQSKDYKADFAVLSQQSISLLSSGKADAPMEVTWNHRDRFLIPSESRGKDTVSPHHSLRSPNACGGSFSPGKIWKFQLFVLTLQAR